jgi:18S rRNA (guanine1575-N7)-methyltransferase
MNKKRDNYKPGMKSKEWIMKKKDRQRRQGRDVKPDTKYTGRKRPRKGF